MKIRMPEDVIYIIDMLEKNGYEAYAVGGCVRDSVLGREPDDWDITTSAKPSEVKRIFAKTVDTGLQHGTVTILLHHTGYEVTTYRIDGEYEDHRHPSQVAYTDDLSKDLERRDFTINAMAYNHKRGLVDIFGGISDINRKVIRCVGEALDRFDEDALRMMRAVRFSSQLGFDIHPDTRKAILSRASALKNVSAERIRVELTKLLLGKDAGMLREVYKTGMTAVFLPEFDAIMPVEQQNPHHVFTVGEHTIRSIEVMNAFFGRYSGKWDQTIITDEVREYTDFLVGPLSEKQEQILCLTMLFHDMGKAQTKTVDENGIGHFYGHAKVSERIVADRMRRLTYDNETFYAVRKLVKNHDRDFGTTEKSMRRAISDIGQEALPLLFLVKFSDAFAQNPVFLEEKLQTLMKTIDLWKKVMASGAAFTVKDLAISGNDVIGLGVKPGPEIGKILQELLERVLDNPSNNEKEKLLSLVKKRIGNGIEIW